MNNHESKNNLRDLFILLVASMLCPSIAFADPIILNPVPLVVVPILLPMEGVIVARLGKGTNPYFWRFVGVWTVITTVTFILLMTAIVAMQNFVGVTIVGIVGEIAVTLAEGIAVFYLLRSPRLTRQPEAAPSLLRSMAYSFVANAFSFIGGLLAVEIPAILWGWGVSNY